MIDKIRETEKVWLSDDFYIDFSNANMVLNDNVIGSIKGQKLYRMLFYFCINLEQVLTKNQIIEYVWNRDENDTSTDDNFKGYISKIRKLNPIFIELLETKVGIGYVMHIKTKKTENTINRFSHVEFAEYTVDKQKEIILRIKKGERPPSKPEIIDAYSDLDFSCTLDFYQNTVYRYHEMIDELNKKIQLLNEKKNEPNSHEYYPYIDQIIDNYKMIIVLLSDKIDLLNRNVERFISYARKKQSRTEIIRNQNIYGQSKPSKIILFRRTKFNFSRFKNIDIICKNLDDILDNLCLLDKLMV